jgi:sugar (pentulose or hexulose) kinase
MQILSDVAGLPLEIAGAQDAASFGAALLAGQSADLIPADSGWPEPAGRFQPRRELADRYGKLLERIRSEVS